jgi:ribose 5-phosphate isomerase B
MTASAIYIACDHGGLLLKNSLNQMLSSSLLTPIIDMGVHTEDAIDYPQQAAALCQKILTHDGASGILICGTGIGMSIAANRHLGIRAALCTEPYSARMARCHNDANILCLGGRITGPHLAFELARVFLSTDFEGERHQRRIDTLDILCT